MKIIKKIRPAVNLKQDEMLHILGGMGANINGGTSCECSGSPNSGSSCNNNTNEKGQCVCKGDGSNTNAGLLCTCNSTNTDSACKKEEDKKPEVSNTGSECLNKPTNNNGETTCYCTHINIGCAS